MKPIVEHVKRLDRTPEANGRQTLAERIRSAIPDVAPNASASEAGRKLRGCRINMRNLATEVEKLERELSSSKCREAELATALALIQADYCHNSNKCLHDPSGERGASHRYQCEEATIALRKVRESKR